MAKMKWTKPSAETLAYFERIAPGPPIEARRMFGMPARFLNGHMLVGVFGNSFMLHLAEDDRAACIRAGAKPFAPMGREAKEYVDVAPGLFDDRTLKEWIVRGMRYLGRLPPKLKKKRGKKPSRERPTEREAAAPRSRKGAAPSARSRARTTNVTASSARATGRDTKAKTARKPPAARAVSGVGRNGSPSRAVGPRRATKSASNKPSPTRKTSRGRG
jgi:hypothetical protein